MPGIRSSFKSFNRFYKNKKRYVAARGEWSGAPELGMKSRELRKSSKKAGMTMNQYRSSEAKKKRAAGKKSFTKISKPKYKYSLDL